MKNEKTLQLRGRDLRPKAKPFIFGILNVTPDSFSDGGRFFDHERAIEAGIRMAEEGADVIDVGGESTRPGSEAIAPDEQIRRTADVIAELVKQFGDDGPAISIDTRSAEVGRAALAAGAKIINDVSALRDNPGLAEVAAEYNAGVILMHMKGTPADMQNNPVYEDLVGEISRFLEQRVAYAIQHGIARERLIIDPGLGFGKTTAHNLEILRRLTELQSLGLPIMIGPSRKRFIGEILDIPEADRRVSGTAAVVAHCVMAGVECLRVHDVQPCREVADMCSAILGYGVE
jgi:dihydropteroate synthase